MIRRINIFAGPGAGKSVMAARIFSELKSRDINVELVTEYVKLWAYQQRLIKSFDQIRLFAEQMHREDVLLYSGIDVVVTDSPVWLACIYAEINSMPGWKNLVALAKEFEEVYPAISVFLDREHREYVGHGRYHTHEQAKEVDGRILQFLDTYVTKDYLRIPYNDYDAMMKHLSNHLKITSFG